MLWGTSDQFAMYEVNRKFQWWQPRVKKQHDWCSFIKESLNIIHKLESYFLSSFSESFWICTTIVKSIRPVPRLLQSPIHNQALNPKPWFWDIISFQFNHRVTSHSLWPHGLQHTRLSCPSPTPRAYSNSCPSSQWCHPTISSSVVPFSSHLQSFPASGSFQMSQFFRSGG